MKMSQEFHGVKGSCSKVRSYPGRQLVAYSGFIIPETGILFTVKPEWFNFETTIDSIRKFIQSMAQQTQKKLYLIMDNAPWHKKAKHLIETEDGYSDIKNAVTIVSLPLYSPGLNLIEQVWRVTRHEKTHNRYESGLPTLTAVLDEWFGSFAEPNEKFASLCSITW